jgi:2-dehydro-3-deoxyphosphogluconate aldolase/(4S)-4-hydroxy-2-oxoglutarate aldolase
MKVVAALRWIAIVRRDTPDAALAMARTLCQAGTELIEVSWTTPNAHAVIEALRAEYPGRWIGAGTVTDLAAAQVAAAAGAQFFVAPNFDAAVGQWASDHEMFYLPGVWTSDEACRAAAAGYQWLKLFPASTGGISHMKALREILPMVQWVPTGGVTPENAKTWLTAGAGAVALSSALMHRTSDELIAAVNQLNTLRQPL